VVTRWLLAPAQGCQARTAENAPRGVRDTPLPGGRANWRLPSPGGGLKLAVGRPLVVEPPTRPGARHPPRARCYSSDRTGAPPVAVIVAVMTPSSDPVEPLSCVNGAAPRPSTKGLSVPTTGPIWTGEPSSPTRSQMPAAAHVHRAARIGASHFPAHVQLAPTSSPPDRDGRGPHWCPGGPRHARATFPRRPSGGDARRSAPASSVPSDWVRMAVDAGVAHWHTTPAAHVRQQAAGYCHRFADLGHTVVGGPKGGPDAPADAPTEDRPLTRRRTYLNIEMRPLTRRRTYLNIEMRPATPPTVRNNELERACDIEWLDRSRGPRDQG
jgi:hypothetical protein